MRRWLLAVAFSACATAPVSGAPPRCPGSSTTMCLTREVCSYDARAGCMMCQCDAYGAPVQGGTLLAPIPHP